MKDIHMDLMTKLSKDRLGINEGIYLFWGGQNNKKLALEIDGALVDDWVCMIHIGIIDRLVLKKER